MTVAEFLKDTNDSLNSCLKRNFSVQNISHLINLPQNTLLDPLGNIKFVSGYENDLYSEVNLFRLRIIRTQFFNRIKQINIEAGFPNWEDFSLYRYISNVKQVHLAELIGNIDTQLAQINKQKIALLNRKKELEVNFSQLIK